MAKEKDAQAAELLGAPSKLINQLIKDTGSRAWVLEKITKAGPPHKQLQHTLVLNRLQELTQLMKKTSGFALKQKKGTPVNAEGHDSELPVRLPAASLAKMGDDGKLLSALTRGPEHEILYTALLLQIIEGLISAQGVE